MSWIGELKFDSQGLVPVVAQETATGEVLMVAFANREALERTAATGQAHYWSRSRSELWLKGATSGHTQAVEEIRVDCDGDAVLYRVRQTGPACHTLATSCFFRRAEEGQLSDAGPSGHVLSRVEAIVAQRDETRPEGSYSTYLFTKGLDKVLKKVGEEASEVIIAAKNDAGPELASETADLLFHLLVALRIRGVPMADVWGEMESRFGASSRVPADGRDPHPSS